MVELVVGLLGCGLRKARDGLNGILDGLFRGLEDGGHCSSMSEVLSH